ncbi:MAG: hypothetical protein LBK75_03560 [Oscillospiraceae bacterium]|jgi:hypothetical protein|nr:hypothetical protein [Oscillospiraceae bacterium]
MAADRRTDIDAMLRGALSSSEMPGTDLINRVKHHSHRENSFTRSLHRPHFVAAVIAAVALVALGTTALAATGVLGNIFAVITGDGKYSPIANGSRKAMVKSGYVETVNVSAPAESGGSALVLNGHYADSREFGFSFTLSDAEIPEEYDRLYVSDLSLEMTNSFGKIYHFEWVIDAENNIESRVFPGGHYFSDRNPDGTNEYSYEPGIGDFTVNADYVKADDGTYDITVIVASIESDIFIAENVHIEIGGLTFVCPGDLQDDEAVDKRVAVDGGWAFDFDLHSKYANVETLTYAVAENATANGVEITSVTVQPGVCRIEAMIDFAKSGLDNPNSTAISAETGFPKAKYDLMVVGVRAQDPKGHVYGDMSNDFMDYDGDVVTCWFEIESMYFDVPETLTLEFRGANEGIVVEVPLVLEK